MKVILLEDVKTLGKKGEMVTVNDGYARNFILPKKLGIEATGKNINDLKLQKANDTRIAQEQLEEAKELKNKIEEKNIRLSIKTGEGGKAFGSISAKEISAAVEDQLGLQVDKKKVQLKELLKTIGTHSVPIKIHPKVIAKLEVLIEEA